MAYSERNLMELLEQAVSPYHTVLAVQQRLEKAGFEALSQCRSWKLKAPGKYYTVSGGSALFAFTVGENLKGEKKMRIAAAHTDYPGFAVKSSPDMEKCGYRQINVEVYGGPILNTWLDRPLSAAGRIALRTDSVWKPEIRYVDLKEPFCTIPNLAIHMNRNVNKGVELNRQTDLIPVAGLTDTEQSREAFLDFLADRAGTDKERILDYDMHLYCTEKPCYTGMNKEFISASHLDNTTSIQALLDAVEAAGSQCPDGIRIAAMFDHEEIGSRTKQGAASMILRDVIMKISRGLADTFHADADELFYTLLDDGFMISADVAHGTHPNYINRIDPTNRPVLGKGFCIKEACAQSYATDTEAIGTVMQICSRSRIPFQKFVNRSDQPGGSTLGAVAAAFLPLPAADIGVPLLAMHSVRELMAGTDMKALSDCITNCFII